MQRSAGLTKDLEEAEKRLEALEARAAAELESRRRLPDQPPPPPDCTRTSVSEAVPHASGPPAPLPTGSAAHVPTPLPTGSAAHVPTVSRMEILSCEPGTTQGLVLWNEEKLFEMLARVVARRDAPVSGTGQASRLTAPAFNAAAVATQLCRLPAEAFVTATQDLLACRRELLEACSGAGLEFVNEPKLGFHGAQVQCRDACDANREFPVPRSEGKWSYVKPQLPPGWLQLLQAAAEAGAIRLVEGFCGIWYIQRGERVREAAWSPQVFDLSLKFTIDLQSLSGGGGRR